MPERNTEVVNNLVFVLTWPVGLYSEVYHGQLSAQEWLQRQACEGGGKLGEEAIPGLIEPESGGAAPQLAVELELLP